MPIKGARLCSKSSKRAQTSSTDGVELAAALALELELGDSNKRPPRAAPSTVG